MNVQNGLHYWFLALPLYYLQFSPLLVPLNIFYAYKSKKAWRLIVFYAVAMLGLAIYDIILGSRIYGFNFEIIGRLFKQGRWWGIWRLYPPFIAATAACTAYGRYIRKAADEAKEQSALEENN